MSQTNTDTPSRAPAADSDPVDPVSSPRGGRTTTALDDVLTRTVGPLPVNVALLLAGAVYAGVGLALPLATGASTAGLISLNVIGAATGWAITLAWLFPAVEARVRRQLLEQTTNLRLLSAREFEHLVGELLRREGWEVQETGGHGEPDGNVDLRIRRGTTRRLVQCKRWDSRPVGVNEVRYLAGTLMREHLTGEDGMLVTLSEFTDTAAKEASELGIELLDGKRLINRLEAAGATDLLRSSTDRPSYPCPECGRAMILGRSRYGYWLRCPSYGRGCKGRRNLGSDPERALAELMRFH